MTWPCERCGIVREGAERLCPAVAFWCVQRFGVNWEWWGCDVRTGNQSAGTRGAVRV